MADRSPNPCPWCDGPTVAFGGDGRKPVHIGCDTEGCWGNVHSTWYILEDSIEAYNRHRRAPVAAPATEGQWPKDGETLVAALRAAPGAEAALNDREALAREVAEKVVLDVCELPDAPDSPDDDPTLLSCHDHELRAIVENAVLRSLAAAPGGEG